MKSNKKKLAQSDKWFLSYCFLKKFTPFLVVALESKMFFAYNFCSGGPILIKFVSNPMFSRMVNSNLLSKLLLNVPKLVYMSIDTLRCNG